MVLVDSGLYSEEDSLMRSIENCILILKQAVLIARVALPRVSYIAELYYILVCPYF